VSAANPQDTKRSGVPLTAGTETKDSQPGEAETPTTHPRKPVLPENGR
jgi:hypothetical protein